MERGSLFVGREHERRELGAALARAARGQGGLLLLAGEPGIGKTRLADHAADEARAAGFEVVWGRCWEGEAPPAYLPWTQVLRALPPPPGGRGRALAPVLPELGQAAAADRETAGFELLEAVAAELSAAAARRPHLIVIDDLHAADPGSLRLLEFVVRSLRGQAVLLLGSYRDAEARLSPEGAALLARIGREGRTLRLARLDSAEIAALAAGRVGHPLPAPLVDSLRRATEGNPLFVAETIELLAARGELERAAEAPLPLPSGVEQVVRDRLVRLSASARRALQLASVLGRECDAALALELLATHGVGAPDEALGESEALGFAARVAGGRLRLSHALVRDAIYASLPLAERRTVHLAASRLYEASAASGLGGDANAAVEAAHHALLALPEGGASRAVALAAGAAGALARRLAFEPAAQMYERALRALPVVPPDPLGRCDLLIALAGCLSSSGAFVAARERAAEASALARAAGDGQRLGAAALAFGAEIRIGVVDPALVTLLEEALAVLPADDVAVRPLVMARLAAARQPADDPAQPLEQAREAVALARRAGQPDLLLRTLHAALAAMVDYAPPDERLPLSTELAVAATARRDRAVAMQARVRAFVDRVELGDVAGADAELVALEGLAREVGHPRYRWRPLLARAMRAAMTGRHDEAARLRQEAVALGVGVEDANFSRVYAFQAFGFALEQGERDSIATTAAVFNELMQGFPGEACWRPVMEALAHVRAGDLVAARTAWQRVPDGHPLLLREALLLVFGGEVAAALGDGARARELEPRLAALGERHLTLGQMGMTWLGPVARVRGLLARVRGAFAEAEAELRLAAEQARAVGAAPFVARVDGDLAALARQRTEAGSGVPARPAAPPPAGLTMTSEGEVWLLAWGDRRVRLRATRGLAMLARLVAEPGRELHALDLSAGGDTEEGAAAGVDGGDAGPLLDARARDAYRARYRELEEALAGAQADGDLGRAARVQAEREALAAELSRGLGLGGRPRRAGDAAERARVNVQRRLKDAVDRVTAADAELGRHLERSVRTGAYCRYEP